MPIRLSDIAFFVGTPREGAAALIAEALSGAGGYACFTSAHGIAASSKSRSIAEAHKAARLVFPDGWPVAWLLRRIGHPAALRLPGPDSMPLVVAVGREPG